MWILVAEDEPSMGDLLVQGLSEQNHTVILARDGEEALSALATSTFDALVLDVMMPRVDGLEVTRQLRSQKNHTPVLLLTALDAPQDIVKGLDAGADDYLVKPFAFSVLTARLRAISRRSSRAPVQELRAEDLCLNPATREVTRGGTKIPLTPTEFRLLELLLRRANRAVSRNSILEAVWGFNEEVESNTLDVFIKMLREKVDTTRPNASSTPYEDSDTFCVTKPAPRSIQFRLAAWYTAILAFTFALIGVGVWLALDRSIEDTADRELQSRLTNVRRYFNGFSPNDLSHLEEEFREEALLGQSGANIRIADAHGNWLFRTPGTEKWPFHPMPRTLPERGTVTTIIVGRRLIRVLTAPVRMGIVQIGLPIDEFEEVRNGFLWLIALGSPVLLILAWVGGYWMSGRALKPVDEISRSAAAIGANKLSARLPSSGSGDELDGCPRF